VGGGDIIWELCRRHKRGRVLYGVEDSCKLQHNIDGSMESAAKWQIKFSFSVCEVIQLGRLNSKIEYTINGNILRCSDEVRDLGVQVHRSIKVAVYVDKFANKV